MLVIKIYWHLQCIQYSAMSLCALTNSLNNVMSYILYNLQFTEEETKPLESR